MANGFGITATMTDEQKNNIAQTIKEYSKRLFSFIRKRVDNPADAEDILQDVFYQFAGNTTPIEQLTAWLFRTARNKITDNYRKKKPELLEDIFSTRYDEEEFSWEEILFTDDSDPEKKYLEQLFWTTLNAALDELPSEQKDAFVKNELEDVPFDTMSSQTGIPVATLISRKRYAVLHLRERLQELKDELLNY
jgi:RNA polymerase sigma factor (sigma-70 family)